MDWSPSYFPDRRFPATWVGGDHDWAVTERTARTRLREARGLTTAFSDGGEPHTVLRLGERGLHVVEHVDPGRPDLVHRLTFADMARVTSLGVLPPGRHHAFGSTKPHVLYDALDPGRGRALTTTLGAQTSRHTGDIRHRHYSREPLDVPEDLLTALHEWDPTAALAQLVELLPALVDRAEAGPWFAYVDDSRERRDAVVARLRVEARSDALLSPAPPGRGLFRRNRPKSRTLAPDPLLLGADGLRDLLDGTGRTFRVHRDDGSRILTSPVPDGEVTFAVTVRKQPAQLLAVTGMVAYLADSKATWSAPRRDQGHAGELTSDHSAALVPLVELGLEVHDAFVEEFTRPVSRVLESVDPPPPAY